MANTLLHLGRPRLGSLAPWPSTAVAGAPLPLAYKSLPASYLVSLNRRMDEDGTSLILGGTSVQNAQIFNQAVKR